MKADIVQYPLTTPDSLEDIYNIFVKELTKIIERRFRELDFQWYDHKVYMEKITTPFMKSGFERNKIIQEVIDGYIKLGWEKVFIDKEYYESKIYCIDLVFISDKISLK